MFYDERINAELGKIYRKGILIATLIGLFYGAFHILYLSFAEQLAIKYLFTELFIVVGGILILLIGAVRFLNAKDERIAFQKHSYYLKAGKIFLVLALSGYALTIPFSSDKHFMDMLPNDIILILSVVGYIYFFYNFKNKDININYSFIDESNGRYYGLVFGNIGKLAGVLAIVFLLASMIDLGLHQSFISFGNIVLGYVYSVIGLGLEYLFISWVEKTSYDEEETDALKKGTFIVGIAFAVSSLISCLLNFMYYAIALSDMQNFSGEIGEILSRVSLLRKPAAYLVTVLYALFLCYLITQMKNHYIKRAVFGILSVSAVYVLCNIVSTFCAYIIRLIIHDQNMIQQIIKAENMLFVILSIITFAVNVIFILVVMEEQKASKSLIAVLVLKWLSLLCGFFTSWRLFVIFLAPLFGLIADICLVFIFKFHKFKSIE